MNKSIKSTLGNRYSAIIEKIFWDRYKYGDIAFRFHRDDLSAAAEALDVALPKNLGDLIYSMRYRSPTPESIAQTAPQGMEWIIEGAGRSEYVFRLVPIARVIPNPSLLTIKIPDSTPEIVGAHALSDEQALLAKVRYNRLIDVFLGVVAYSLQNHLRTTVKGVGQVEIDEIYVAVDKRGRQFVIPVQAKGGNDKLSVVQTKQDIDCCQEKFRGLNCRPVSAQFMSQDQIALFELALTSDGVRIVDEKHYRLVAASEICSEDFREYNLD